MGEAGGGQALPFVWVTALTRPDTGEAVPGAGGGGSVLSWTRVDTERHPRGPWAAGLLMPPDEPELLDARCSDRCAVSLRSALVPHGVQALPVGVRLCLPLPQCVSSSPAAGRLRLTPGPQIFARKERGRVSVASSKQTLGLNQALRWCPARVSLETPRLCPFSGLGVAGLRDPKPRPVRSLPFFLLTGSQLVTKVEGSCDGKSTSQRSRMAFAATTRPSWAQVGLRATCGPRGKSSLLSRALGWGGGGLCRVVPCFGELIWPALLTETPLNPDT